MGSGLGLFAAVECMLSENMLHTPVCNVASDDEALVDKPP